MFKGHKERVRHFMFGGESYKKEVRRQIRLLIVVTLGFTIAFTWRQTVFDVFQTAIQAIFHSENAAANSILTSLAITLISLLLIMLTSFLLQNTKDY